MFKRNKNTEKPAESALTPDMQRAFMHLSQEVRGEMEVLAIYDPDKLLHQYEMQQGAARLEDITDEARRAHKLRSAAAYELLIYKLRLESPNGDIAHILAEMAGHRRTSGEVKDGTFVTGIELEARQLSSPDHTPRIRDRHAGNAAISAANSDG